jgi:hypothetical protein
MAGLTPELRPQEDSAALPARSHASDARVIARRAPGTTSTVASLNGIMRESRRLTPKKALKKALAGLALRLTGILLNIGA